MRLNPVGRRSCARFRPSGSHRTVRERQFGRGSDSVCAASEWCDLQPTITRVYERAARTHGSTRPSRREAALRRRANLLDSRLLSRLIPLGPRQLLPAKYDAHTLCPHSSGHCPTNDQHHDRTAQPFSPRPALERFPRRRRSTVGRSIPFGRSPGKVDTFDRLNHFDTAPHCRSPHARVEIGAKRPWPGLLGWMQPAGRILA